MRAEAAVPSEEDVPTPAEAPVIMLGPLENKSCVDELSDGVQSMDVRWDFFVCLYQMFSAASGFVHTAELDALKSTISFNQVFEV